MWNIPFVVTTSIIVILIWLYSHRSGLKTIVWTDAVQTLCLLAALVLMIVEVGQAMNMGFAQMVQDVAQNEHFRLFEFDDWQSKQIFWRQFLSGIFISIVMVGLDQDMMQKNLSCKTLKDAQKNMYFYAIASIPVNFLFLFLGVLLIIFATRQGIALPALSDEILPLFATEYLGNTVLVCFCIGIIAAAFSSADSALTALTTSFCIDILDIQKYDVEKGITIRKLTHLFICVAFVLIIIGIKILNNKSIIDAIYIVAGYTYGPLLGLFIFGLFTRIKAHDRWIPYIAILSPLLCFGLDRLAIHVWGYAFGYEMLMINGLLTFCGLWLSSFCIEVG